MHTLYAYALLPKVSQHIWLVLGVWLGLVVDVWCGTVASLLLVRARLVIVRHRAHQGSLLSEGDVFAFCVADQRNPLHRTCVYPRNPGGSFVS